MAATLLQHCQVPNANVVSRDIFFIPQLEVHKEIANLYFRICDLQFKCVRNVSFIDILWKKVLF